ncbi:MAG: hypothetical protein HWD60_02860 [Defluviicoccus sp.]|nr:MAG: hypothetical protein HWD60_02860 [Defluviicoccus sp.]
MTRSIDTMVVGAGPVGLVAALVAARQGRRVALVGAGPSAEAPRIDAVPAPFLALLLELGVHPVRLGVRDLHDTRLVAWERAEPEVVRGRAMAHIERPALEKALLGLVERTPGIELIATRAFRLGVSPVIIDATGRRAVSARRIVAPPEPRIARVFVASGRFGPPAQAFGIAALPDGYAYRLGTDHRIVLGIVGEKAAVRRPLAEIEGHLRGLGAGWLLAACRRRGRNDRREGGVASVQWSEGGTRVLRVGDAELARDALASQGLASGVSDALHVAAGETRPGWARRRQDQRDTHVGRLRGLVARCRFHDCPAWSRYADFLNAHAASPAG